MLNSAEELLLFLLDEPNGTLLPITSRTERLALAGAVLMDLQLENRIDTDLDTLTLSDPEPLGDPVLDPTLADIAGMDGTRDAVFWVERTAERGREIREGAIASLVARGILSEPEEDGFLALTAGASHARRYPAINGEVQEDVNLRVMRVLFNDEIPDPRDIVIISLVDACDLWRRMLVASELSKARQRIKIVSRLDLIGQAVRTLVRVARPVDRATGGVRDLPMVRGLPLIGSTFDLLRDQRSFYRDNYLRLGPVFRVRTLMRTYITLAGRDANLFMSSGERSHMHTANMWNPLCEGLGASRFMPNANGKDHLRMRRELKHWFSRSFVEGRIPDAVEALRGILAELPLDTPLPGLLTIQRLFLETAGMLLVNASPREHVSDAIVLTRTLMFRGTTDIPSVVTTRRFRRAKRRVSEFLDDVLVQHQLYQRGRTRDVVDDLLELHRADPNFLPEIDLPINVLLPIFAGIDTAASVGAVMLYAVLKDPELGHRVQVESDAAFVGGTPSAEALKDLDIAPRVMLETMRMFTPGPGQMRRVTTSFDFAGCRIPAGEDIVVAETVTHDLPEFFPDPSRFDIDRYLPGREEHKQSGVYAPFGLGLHNCLGRGFAEVQLPLMLATLLHEMNVELSPPDYVLGTIARPFCRPDDGFKFTLTRR